MKTRIGECLLLLRKSLALLQIGTGAKAGINSARDDERAGRALLVLAGHAAEALLPRSHGLLLAGSGIVLRVDGVDLVAELRQQSARNGVARGRAVELENADVARVGRREVGHPDDGTRGGLGRVEAAAGDADEARE